MNVVPRLPLRAYRSAGACLPLLCVDGILGSSDNPYKFLLVKRTSPPFSGEWWVPGGRVFKGETVEQAFRRVIREELGVSLGRDIRMVGIYQLRYDALDADVPGGRHTVSVVFEAMVPKGAVVKLDGQASEWMWADRLPEKFRIQEV